MSRAGKSYDEVTQRKNEIMKDALGIDYDRFSIGTIGFDYEKMMEEVGYPLEETIRIQRETGVGQTPLVEMKNITKLVRSMSEPGKGATILVKDEAQNPSGSFKARRAALSVYEAQKRGYEGVIAATSGNYGAAVASQAAMRGMKCIVVQETHDSRGVGQPEILEKGRICEALGAEVVQLTVGPELFYQFLVLLEETKFFNASLYSPYGIAGIETLGYEIATEVKERYGKEPAAVITTHAGGGNVTGTARGIKKAHCDNTKIIAASVDLSGLHMASDKDFNKKSFTTGHTGFGMPFMTWPDRSDVPKNAARPLRYIDRYVTMTQGEVFYACEMLAQLEGIERGPAGSISLAAAIAIAKELNDDEVIVVQETEYTGAGKHPTAQLTFATKQGIEVRRGNPEEGIPGKSVVIPEKPEQMSVKDYDIDKLRTSYLKNALKDVDIKTLIKEDIDYLAEEIRKDSSFVKEYIEKMGS
ncbi:Pyridoxal-5'-phosphate-dependent protein, beta subunit [Alkaliphilus metalliredigens QYMF]|uniref:Pyridoxal-5'-phosphate-dependent protein, beta subunit n=1 Tax=Alkaliphilus metalliredigens (strain QYMF) TaxID=293826 RepID=A6TKL8_ALKMQ|nr:2-amino-4-oxopentanoate thiolase subunit OrtB [Alkaliphilus metalliredigens]ABR46736.1 Pyridoxal-5'-phosphate-dependent protein, beta subunit [Alkaliphilus metalliredigens QYMF]